MEKVEACPICNSTAFTPYLVCTDNTVSKETFSIVQCASCAFKFTNPRPHSSKIGKYYQSEDYVSHSNTNKGFVNSTYQLIRQYTLLKKLQLLSKFFKQGSMLDIGCGTGEFLNTCKKAKWNTTGIEPDSGARNRAIKKYALTVHDESELTNIPNERFEVITLWHVLEHVPALNERVLELKRLIKPNGVIVVAVPNCNSLDAAIYKEHWAAYDVPRHLYHFAPNNMEQLFLKHGMQVFQIMPMLFDSFYVALLSEKIKSGNTNIINALWNGLRSNLSAIQSRKTYSSQIYLIRK
jgi:2-polyprenyl-3-methyl-5-hydroxy-6-metoxy-1,4-benzoquinol methylase